MSRGPGDHWEKLQIILQNRGRGQRFNFGGGFPGGGRGGWGLAGSLLVFGVGGWALSNSLFNGEGLGFALFGDGYRPWC